MLTRQAYYSIMSIRSQHRGSNGETDLPYSFHFNEMARLAGLEPAPFCLEGVKY